RDQPEAGRGRAADDGAGALGGGLAVGVQVAGEGDVLGGLGDPQSADGDVDGGEGAGGDVEVGVDAVAQETVAVDGDEVAGEVLAERAGAGEEPLPAAVHDEEAVALDGEVAGVAGGGDGADGEVALGAGDVDAEADLEGVGPAGNGTG